MAAAARTTSDVKEGTLVPWLSDRPAREWVRDCIILLPPVGTFLLSSYLGTHVFLLVGAFLAVTALITIVSPSSLEAGIMMAVAFPLLLLGLGTLPAWATAWMHDMWAPLVPSALCIPPGVMLRKCMADWRADKAESAWIAWDRPAGFPCSLAAYAISRDEWSIGREKLLDCLLHTPASFGQSEKRHIVSGIRSPCVELEHRRLFLDFFLGKPAADRLFARLEQAFAVASLDEAWAMLVSIHHLSAAASSTACEPEGIRRAVARLETSIDALVEEAHWQKSRREEAERTRYVESLRRAEEAMTG